MKRYRLTIKKPTSLIAVKKCFLTKNKRNLDKIAKDRHFCKKFQQGIRNLNRE